MNTTQLLAFVIVPLLATAGVAITAYVGYAKEKATAAEKEKTEAASKAKEAAEKAASEKQDEIKRLTVQISALTQKLADADPEKTKLLQIVAANVGSANELREIINLVSQKLNAERKVSDALLDDIITQARIKSGDYRKMVASKEKLIERRMNVYLLNWKPLFDLVIEDFDSMMKKLKASGYPVEVGSTTVPFAETPHNSSKQPRSASLGNLRLNLQLNTAGFRPDASDDAYFFLHLLDAKTNQSLVDQPFSLQISENGAACNGRQFPVSANGSKEFLDEVRKGMATVFERMVTVYEAQK